MDIRFNPSQSAGHSAKTGRSRKVGKKSLHPSVSKTDSDGYDSKLLNQLIDQLSRMPEKRESFLNEARELLEDPDYPNEKQLEELEKVLERLRSGRSQ